MSEPPPPSSGLAALLLERRQELVDRWTAMVARETAKGSLPQTELVDQMPTFIDALITALAETTPPAQTGREAVEHGAQRLRLGFDAAEVVREYGMLHRCIIAIADEAGRAPSAHEQTILAQCLTEGSAAAVSQYVRERDSELRRQMSEHLGFIAHEVRNPLSSARMAFDLLRQKELTAGGRAVELLARTLRRTNDVIDDALTQTSLSLGVKPRFEGLELRGVLDEVVFNLSADAQHKGLRIDVAAPDDLILEADKRLLHSALSNLLRNAVKFSHKSPTISVRAQRRAGVVSIEVEDSCGGLPPGRAEDLFEPLVQRGPDRSGFGLGLAIARQAAAAHGGTLGVRDLPGKGCVFALELPERRPA